MEQPSPGEEVQAGAETAGATADAPLQGDVPPGFVPPPDGAQPPPTLIATECAFLVFKHESGKWMATSDLNAQLQVGRGATTDDFFMAAAMIQRDITALETANATVQIQMSKAMQLAQQMENAKLAQAALGGGMPAGAMDLSGLRRPPGP